MSKISQIIDAGRNLEKTKNGFTVTELMSTLKWGDKEKQYVLNTMFLLTKRGQAHKLNNSRPVIYTLKPHAGAKIKKPEKSKSDKKSRQSAPTVEEARTENASEQDKQQEASTSRQSVISLEDLANMEIPLELVGEGVFRRNRELERRIYELESELVETKRRLDDANKRNSEQTRMIEKQNQIISDQNRERRPKIPTTKMKDVAAVDWKRRS